MDRHDYRKSPWRFVFLAGAVLSGGWLMLYGLLQLLAKLLPLNVSLGEAATIGIIGGADGPTAVFITGPDIRGLLVMAITFSVCILGFSRLSRCRKK